MPFPPKAKAPPVQAAPLDDPAMMAPPPPTKAPPPKGKVPPPKGKSKAPPPKKKAAPPAAAPGAAPGGVQSPGDARLAAALTSRLQQRDKRGGSF
jgi:hypothetical protein